MTKDIIDELIKQGENLNRQFVNKIGTVSSRRVATENILARPQTTVITADTVDPSYFMVGEINYVHPQSILSSGYLLSDGTSHISSTAVVRVVNNNNEFLEYFNHSDFKNVANTTATWGSGTLSFTSGQIAQSESVALGSGTIVQATLNVTSSSGTFTYYLSANGGSNWETVTPDVIYTFTNSGSDLRWKVSESGASTGAIERIKITAVY
jgi:hypothetical protein